MKKVLLLAYLITLGFFSADLYGQEFSLGSVITWQCSFPFTAYPEWESANPTIISDTQDFTSLIDNVDVEEGTARLIGNSGSSDLLVVPFGTMSGDTGLTFIEVSPLNVWNLTVIYPTPSPPVSGRRSFKAVISRHPDIFGPSPSQAYGFCTQWE